MGNLVFQATLGGQVNLVGPNTASTFNLNVPAIAGTLVTTGDTGTVTNTMCATSVYTAPGTIGSGTPNTGAFTTLTASTSMRSPIVGAGTSSNLSLQSNATTQATLDTSGNLGLGVTPSAWGSGWKALQFGSGGSAFTNGTTDARIGANTYYTGSTFAAINTGAASRYEQVAGAHYWLNAASVSAGTSQTFTQAMTLNASGNLIVGATSDSGSRFKVVGSGGGELYIDASGKNFYNGSEHVFQNGGGLAVYGKFDSSGNLLVGTTTNSDFSSTLRFKSETTGYPGLFKSTGSNAREALSLWNTASSGTISLCSFLVGAGSGVGSITSNGTSTTYGTSSDYRLKENIQPMQNALATVAQLNPVTYNWKANGSEGQGFIAHELQAVVPDCVTGEKDATRIEQYEISPAVAATFDEEGNELTPAVEAVMGEREVPVYQGIDTSFLVATLTAALQEAHGLIKDLQTRVAALES